VVAEAALLGQARDLLDVADVGPAGGAVLARPGTAHPDGVAEA
jgi:hypothetical protein